MKPKTKFQKQIVNWSKKLPNISEPQKNWAYKNCFEHYAHCTKKGATTCLECGKQWTIKHNTAKSCVCPHCGVKLKIDNTRKRVFKQADYITILTANNGCQVFRFLYVYSECKVGKPAHYFCSEVVQHWLAPNGKCATLALLRPIYGFYDTWQFGSDLEIRPDKQLYNIQAAIYPRKKIIGEIKRNGFTGQYYGFTPYELFHLILTNNRAETLLKAGQFEMLRYFGRAKYKIENDYWASLKICIRNKYLIEDGAMWCDYLDLLKFFGKDINNPKYICPDNLKTVHDRMMEKKRIVRERERLEQQRMKAQEDEQRFKELKQKFFGIAFTDGEIQVKVLESVNDFVEEARFMHHCVLESGYHLRPDSLILSACIDGKRLETVEVSLKTLNVIQSHGVFNQNTQYHDRIVNLVNKNKRIIRRRIIA